MAKLLVLLVLSIYLVLQLGGDDPAQLRPGLAGAGAGPIVPTTVAEPVATRAPGDATLASDALAAPAAGLSDRSMPPPRLAAAPGVGASEAAGLPEAFSPAPALAAPPRQPGQVFTLSAPPGQRDALAVTRAEPPAAATPEPQVRHVTARSVNVRLYASTDAPIVGRLMRGDAASMLAENGAGWALVSVEGEGLSGFVSMNYLSPAAP